MIKISELKEGDVLKAGGATATILHNLGKIVFIENCKGLTNFYSEKELNNGGWELEVTPTPEKKYFMGFEVREYPERPIVEVSDVEGGGYRCLRRLIEVKEDCVICVNEVNNATTEWGVIYRIPETNIVEPTEPNN